MVLTAVMLLLGALFWLSPEMGSWVTGHLDYDRLGYVTAAGRWLETGTPYLASEVAAAGDYSRWTFLHPPIALPLFAPFVFLPPIVWYALPVAILGWTIVGWRPASWSWPILAAWVAWPRSVSMLVVGNTDLWIAAFVALGFRFRWPFALVALKPSFAPLVALGLTDRRWWIAVLGLALGSLLFGSLWWEWLRVVDNSPADPLYSILALPLVFLLPATAWFARTRRRSARAVVPGETDETA